MKFIISLPFNIIFRNIDANHVKTSIVQQEERIKILRDI